MEYKPLPSGPSNGDKKETEASGESEVSMHVINYPSILLCYDQVLLTISGLSSSEYLLEGTRPSSFCLGCISRASDFQSKLL